jgi:2'-5' RNA ligase
VREAFRRISLTAFELDMTGLGCFGQACNCVLFNSELRSGGSTYTVIERFPLGPYAVST